MPSEPKADLSCLFVAAISFLKSEESAPIFTNNSATVDTRPPPSF